MTKSSALPAGDRGRRDGVAIEKTGFVFEKLVLHEDVKRSYFWPTSYILVFPAVPVSDMNIRPPEFSPLLENRTIFLKSLHTGVQGCPKSGAGDLNPSGAVPLRAERQLLTWCAINRACCCKYATGKRRP